MTTAATCVAVTGARAEGTHTPTTSSPCENPATFEARAQALLDLDWSARALASRNARSEKYLTGADVDEVLFTRYVLAEEIDAFRREFFPRAGRVVAVAGSVYVVSPAGRRTRRVFDQALGRS